MRSEILRSKPTASNGIERKISDGKLTTENTENAERIEPGWLSSLDPRRWTSFLVPPPSVFKNKNAFYAPW